MYDPPKKHNNDTFIDYTFLCNTDLINQYIYDSFATHAQRKNNHNPFAGAIMNFTKPDKAKSRLLSQRKKKRTISGSDVIDPTLDEE